MSQKEVQFQSVLNGIKNKEFEWSLEPIIVLMNILGQGMVISADIQVDKKRLSFRSFCILILGLAILLLNIIINVISSVKVWYSSLASYSRGAVGFLNIVVGFVFNDLMVIGIPLSFMFICIFSRRWKSLLSNLQLIQSEMKLSNHLHQKLRKYAFLSVFLLLLVSLQHFCFVSDFKISLKFIK